MSLDALYRRGMLLISGSKAAERLIKGVGRPAVRRFVAGERLEQALDVSRELHAEGLTTILDLLGEFVDTEAGAAVMVTEIVASLELLDATVQPRIMSVKPTQLGLAVDFELALANARRIVEQAHAQGVHICLDMENYPHVERTLALYRCLHASGLTSVSTVLQSYLYRSLDDLQELTRMDPKPELRIVKGAYLESPKVAMQDKRQVDRSFRELVFKGFEAGAKINVATHDDAIVREVEAYVRGARLEASDYEFQFLYGVKPTLQRSLAKAGHVVRIYVPYGKDWYGYFSRRLAERPANLLFIVRGLFG